MPPDPTFACADPHYICRDPKLLVDLTTASAMSAVEADLI